MLPPVPKKQNLKIFRPLGRPGRLAELLLPGGVRGGEEVSDRPGDLPAQLLHQGLHLQPRLGRIFVLRSVGTGLGGRLAHSRLEAHHVADTSSLMP